MEDEIRKLKEHLGIREWLYYESSRYRALDDSKTPYHPILRRVDAVTGRRERRSFTGEWHQSNLEYSKQYVESYYGR
jgi:hypothetical protein